MCDLNGPIRFCTCNAQIDTAKPHWTLKTDCKRSYTNLEQEIMGTFSSKFMLSLEFLSRLNSENLFDFEYRPSQNDILTLMLSSNQSHTFIYNSGQWEVKSPFGFTTSYWHGNKQSGFIDTNQNDTKR